MKKKVFATLMAASMAASVLLGSTSVLAADYSVAIPLPESGITMFEIMRSNMDQLEDVTGGEFINAPAELTPDGILSFVESQVAAGVDGLILVPPSDSVLPTITTLCEEAGIYWGISMRTISDPDIKEMVEASPYYIGNCYEDEYTTGYNCGKWMGEAGYKKIAIISQATGDTTCDTRELGLAEACEEFGIEIVAESRGHAQASDATQATESFLAANADLDAIFVVGSAVSGEHEAVIKAIQDAGREDVSLVTVDFPNEMAADFETGILKYSFGPVSLAYDPELLLIKLVNAIKGTPVLNADGGSVTSNSMTVLGIDNLEDAQDYMELLGNPKFLFFTDDEISNMMVENNPDLDEAALQEIIDNYSFE